MMDILVRPQELRQSAQQLRTSAKKISGAAGGVGNIVMGSALRLVFSGNRALALMKRYLSKASELASFDDLVMKFVNDLEQAADKFEKADIAIENSLYVHDPWDSHEIHVNDVMQGDLGDCYLIAAIAAIAHQNPDLIRKLIRDNGDGTYTVTFYEKNSFLFFEIDGFTKKEFTVSLNGTEYAQIGDQIGMNQEVWVQVLEKAYAEWKGGYKAIEGGWPHNALEALTGVDAQDFKPASLSAQDFATRLKNGEAITASSLPDYKIWGLDLPDSSDWSDLYQNDVLFNNHAYTVTDVDVEKGTVTLRNPWGYKHATVTIEEFQKNFSNVSVVDVR